MVDPVKLSKSRIFNPFDEKREFSTVISWFEYRARPGPGWNISHDEARSRLPNWAKKSPLGNVGNSCAEPNEVQPFEKFWERLTFDPSIESSHQDKKDSIICPYSKNEPISRYRRVNLKIVIFESSISLSSSKTEIFHCNILSFRPRINQEL